MKSPQDGENRSVSSSANDTISNVIDKQTDIINWQSNLIRELSNVLLQHISSEEYNAIIAKFDGLKKRD